MGRLKGTCNPLGPRYTPGSQVHVALYVLGIFEGTCNSPGPRYTPGSQVHLWVSDTPLGLRYTFGSQVHLRVSVTPPGLRYMSRFMFWVYLKIPAILRVPGTPPGPRYTLRSQVHPRFPGTPPGLGYTSGSQLHVRDSGIRRTSCFGYILQASGSQVYPRMSSTPPGLKYTSRFIFWVYLKVPAILWVPGIPPVPMYTPGSLNDNKDPTALAEELQESTGLKDFYFGPLAGGLGPERPRDPLGHRAGPGALGPCLTVCRHASASGSLGRLGSSKYEVILITRN